MIFRLGYEPQTLDLGGVKVENFGKAIADGCAADVDDDRSQARQARSRRRRRTAQANTAAVEGGELAFEVDAGEGDPPDQPRTSTASTRRRTTARA